MPREFLRAHWKNLALLTYDIDPNLLSDVTPPDCTLDLRDGRAFVSLVAFDFLNTRVLRIAWPGYRNFPEINLRFYVRHRAERGVCFIREFVPRRVVALLANLFYNEPYKAAEMSSRVAETSDSIAVEHSLNFAGRRGQLSISAAKPGVIPAENSIEHFFKEHEWGFGTSRRGSLLRYRVNHPVWEIYPITHYALDWDWAGIYGPKWEFLRDRKPISVILAAGSPVTVYPVRRLAPSAKETTPSAEELTPSAAASPSNPQTPAPPGRIP
jgi:uncharacterized protein YqjF (DUF2071 family)